MHDIIEARHELVEEACGVPDAEPRRSEPVEPTCPVVDAESRRSELVEGACGVPDAEPSRSELVEGSPESPGPSLQQERDLAGLLDALACPVRQRILFALAAGASMNVTALAAHTRIAQKALSHHLGFLRAAGLVHSQRRGREIWYETAHPRIRCHRDEAGACTLTLTAPGGGVVVTVTLSCSEGKDAGP